MGNFRLNKSLQRQDLPNRSQNRQTNQRGYQAQRIPQAQRVEPQTRPVALPDIFFDEQGRLDPYEVCPPTPPGWDSNDWYSTCMQDLGIEEYYANLGLI